MTPARWVVVGSSGFVGRHVMAALRGAGLDVHGVAAPRLTAPEDADTPTLLRLARAAAAATTTAAEQGAAHALVDALRGAAVVVNCAGLAAPDAAASPQLTGANALLPATLALLTPADAQLVHLTSAAVQGNRPRLDESGLTAPTSPYARSKARGEEVLTALAGTRPGIVMIRATSVQGADRPTTQRLRRVARSPFASVAAPGDRPTPVTSVTALAELVLAVGRHTGDKPLVVLQPWEGMTTAGVLRTASGGREPHVLPPALCRGVVGAGYLASRVLGGRFVGAVRRAEVMWFGQEQVDGWCARVGITPRPGVAEALAPRQETA